MQTRAGDFVLPILIAVLIGTIASAMPPGQFNERPSMRNFWIGIAVTLAAFAVWSLLSP